MKRLLSISILVITLLTCQYTFAQEERSTFDLKRSINLFEKNNKTENIIVNVSEKTSSINLLISCKVFSGNLKIEIYDSKGTKKNEFYVESQMDDETPKDENSSYEKEIVEGAIEKTIHNPIAGKWIIKLIPEEVTASVEINSRSVAFD
ncbi:hypothetical protein [Psychroserpens mesophilus]|uniref:hypothetical protein n=1 Tax=Psychroserpens mesophilus TaxID=325473 RepID=UPI003D6543E7